ncbi:acyl-CoA dehydrogenase family protein [Sorangium sp. So ce1153]|uniref:acyl-CoA dehydrogenase family protein n=1 Tax=Sorangium sp. So ce1153 TaxID=3133333 RepID=UPI003F5DD77A
MSTSHRSPARADLLAQVERIKEIALRHADDSERGRTLAPPVVDALRASGLLKMCAPREVGGDEIDPLTHLEIAEAAARIDTATGWSLSINAYSAACAGAYLPDAGVERVFQRGFPIVAGALLPAGVARRVPGGYVIRGRWAFGSAIRHAGWVISSAAVAPEDGQPPAEGPGLITFLIEREHVRIEDTWDTSGMRGTGSDHYQVEDAFVAEELTFPFSNAPAQRGGLVFSLPTLPSVMPAHVGFALGVAQRALDELLPMASRRVNMWTSTRVADSPAFQMDLGRAAAKLAATRAYAFSVIGSVWDRFNAGGPLSIEEHSAIRLAGAHATDVAAEVTTFAYRAAGASVLYASCPLQQYFRDIHGATQHIAVSDDAYQAFGRLRLGHDVSHPLFAPRSPRDSVGGE